MILDAEDCLVFRFFFIDAEEWIKKLNQNGLAGFCDWSLPILDEAMSLIEPEEKKIDMSIPFFIKNKDGL
jgi:hypothetical protein